jgi:hypothetical protein
MGIDARGSDPCRWELNVGINIAIQKWIQNKYGGTLWEHNKF